MNKNDYTKIDDRWVKLGEETSVGVFEIIEIPQWLQEICEEEFYS